MGTAHHQAARGRKGTTVFPLGGVPRGNPDERGWIKKSRLSCGPRAREVRVWKAVPPRLRAEDPAARPAPRDPRLRADGKWHFATGLGSWFAPKMVFLGEVLSQRKDVSLRKGGENVHRGTRSLRETHLGLQATADLASPRRQQRGSRTHRRTAEVFSENQCLCGVTACTIYQQ